MLHTDDTLYESAFSDPIASVTITKISRDGVLGTFSGEVLKPGSNVPLIITNGNFSIYNYKQ